MSDDHRISKVEILMQQKKYAEAERILKDLLAQDSNNVGFLALLAELNLQQDRLGNAHSLINNAIGIAPDAAYLYHTKSRIALGLHDYNEAEKSVRTAIELDANDADFFALLAHIRLERKDFKEALSLADRALGIDSENLLALNTRSTALLKLDRHEDSFQTIHGALREDPNNAYTHANYGWNLLEKGDHKKALEHFREALKNDPSHNYARAGMAEALKASNPVYKLFLKYAFFMQNLTAKYQWAVIIGFYFGVRFLRSIAQSNEQLQPYLVPLIIALSIVAFSTWVIDPISNLFLRFNRYGQFLLDKHEKMSSNLVAVAFALFVVGLLGYVFSSDDRLLVIGAYGFGMMVPLSVIFNPSKYKYAMVAYGIAMAVIGIVAIAATFSSGELFNSYSVIFMFAFVAFQWLANFFIIRESNK
jgi:tetratricopeptide (TPR) repeat protein